VAETKELLDSMIDSDFEPGCWESARVPFLSNGGGSYMCVDVLGRDGHPPGCLVEFWKRDRDRPVIAPSLEAWLAGFVVSLERNRWEKTCTGCFECVMRQDDE
jgi:cell wall assembly regulator SMI1